MSFEYIQRSYCVPAERGRRVIYSGKPGVIIGERGHYIEVVLDGDNHEGIYHPTDKMEYGDMAPIPVAGKLWRCLPPWRDESETDAWFTVTAATRSKARYRAFRALLDVCDHNPQYMLGIRVLAA